MKILLNSQLKKPGFINSIKKIIMREQIIKILEYNNLLASDLEGVFAAMGSILELASDQIAENEPHAYKTIERYRDVANSISDADDFIQQISY